MSKWCSGPLRLEVEEWTGSEGDSKLHSMPPQISNLVSPKRLQRKGTIPISSTNPRLKCSVRSSFLGIQLLVPSGVMMFEPWQRETIKWLSLYIADVKM